LDGGTVWDELGGVDDASGYCNGYTMVFHPTNPGVLYVGGSYYDYVDQTSYMCVGKTTNAGASWAFWELTQDYGEAYALAIDAGNPQTMYAGGYSSAGARLFKTTDGGSSWTNATGSVIGTVSAIAVDPSSPSTVYCGDYYGPYRSTDGGVSWTRTGTFDVNSIALSPSQSTELYAAGDYGAYSSTDGGVTWAAMNNGLGNLEVWSLAAHPTTSGMVFAGTGGGGVYQYAQEPHVVVTSPAAGVQWAIGDTEQIQWTSWGTSGTVRIEISRDGGGTWADIAGTFPDIGTCAWNVTGPPSVSCIIRVTDTDGSPVGVSGTFSVAETYVQVTAPAAGVDWPIGSSQHIQWSSWGTSGTVTIEISRDGGVTWTTLESTTPDDGDHLWSVTGPASATCAVRVADTDGSPVGESGMFSVSDAPYVTVISPSEGAQWEVGTAQIILWTSMGTSGTVSVEISRDGGSTWTSVDAGTPDDGDYLWTVTGPTSESCVVRVCDGDGAPEGLSGTFTIFSTAADDPPVPGTLALDLLGPNPTAGPVTLLCALPEPCDVGLAVYDTQGRLYTWLHRGRLPAGRHILRWDSGLDGRRAAPGRYVVRLQACGDVVSRSLTLTR
jgi:hypothetical protein